MYVEKPMFGLEILYESELCRSRFYSGGRPVTEAAMEAPRLAEYVMSLLEEARRRNPHLTHLDKLAEVLPPRQMTHWPYLVGKWSTE